MHIMLWLLRCNLRRQWQYRANFIGHLILTSLYYIAQFFYLDKIIELGSGDLSRQRVYLIFFLFGLIFLVVETLGASVHRFFQIVAQGRIEPFLVKPIGTWSLIFLGWSAPGNLVIALIFVLCVVAGTDVLNISASLTQWLAFSLAVLCATAVNLLMILGLNLLTFVSQRHLPVDYIHERIFDLSLVPVGLFPSGVLRWLILIVPVATTSSVPAAVLLDAQFLLLGYLVTSTLIMIFLVGWGYRSTFKRYSGLGG